MQAAEPAGAMVPGGHGAQNVEPFMDWLVPRGHGVHDHAPDAFEKEPGAQGTHCPSGVPVPEAKVPGWHSKQVEEPCAEKVPLGQLVHCVAPSPLAKDPAGQGEQPAA
jgi:hypothetical protein